MTTLLQRFSDKYYVRGLPRVLFAMRARRSDPQVISDPDGVQTWCDPNNHFQFHIRWGNYEHSVRQLIRDCLRPGDTFVDIGCNVGYLSCVAAARVGSTGKVISVDPNPGVIELTQRNADLNGFDWIETHCAAAGAVCGFAKLRVGTEHSLSTLREDLKGINVASVLDVPVIQIDSLLEESGPIRMVKIDTEGFESEVLSGMTKLIASKQTHFIFEHVGNCFDDPEKVLTANLAHFADGYRAFWLPTKMPKKWLERKRVRRIEITQSNHAEVANSKGDVLIVPTGSDLLQACEQGNP